VSRRRARRRGTHSPRRLRTNASDRQARDTSNDAPNGEGRSPSARAVVRSDRLEPTTRNNAWKANLCKVPTHQTRPLFRVRIFVMSFWSEVSEKNKTPFLRSPESRFPRTSARYVPDSVERLTDEPA
jgi:hypothetical protein